MCGFSAGAVGDAIAGKAAPAFIDGIEGCVRGPCEATDIEGHHMLKDKVAVITGAGSGIGRAIAVRFGAEGARVVAVGQREERVAETIRLVEKAGGEGMPFAGSVDDLDRVRALIAATVERYGRLDVMVNNAAKNRPDEPLAETVAEMSEEWWAATIGVNLTGAYYCCKYALQQMLKSGGGCIINVASTAGLKGNRNQGAYVSSKHGLVGLTKSIALDYAAKNVRSVAICPGFIETERSTKFSDHNRGPDWRDTQAQNIPLGRLGRPEDVASLAAFLASDEASFITGVAIPIDGGTAATR